MTRPTFVAIGAPVAPVPRLAHESFPPGPFIWFPTESPAHGPPPPDLRRQSQDPLRRPRTGHFGPGFQGRRDRVQRAEARAAQLTKTGQACWRGRVVQYG